MIQPAPTSSIDPTLARGVLEENVPATATRPAHIVVSFLNTSYRMHLIPNPPTRPVSTPVGKRIVGRIDVSARRVDVVDTGGRYVEPVYGHPRRVQGSVLQTDDGTNTITVDACVPIHLRLTDRRQAASEFAIGVLVSCDVLDGATFTPTT
jgi:hypothetical protein